MKAAFLTRTGEPDVIEYGDLPDPKPGANDVIVRMKAASLNPIDTYIRSGTVPMPIPNPFVPGCDVAGVVESVGDGVKRFRAGDRVWASNQGVLGRQGTFSELVCVNEEYLYPTPGGVSDEDAAAASLVGITAHLGLFECATLKPGETVFVNGGTGGVGSMVVQMAKAAGAKVITTVGSPEKAKLASEYGADHVINYKTDDLADAVKKSTEGKGVQVWYETQREPDFEKTVELLVPRGRMVIMAGRQAKPPFPVGPFYVKGLSLFGFAMFNMPPDVQRRCAEDMNRWLAEGKLRPHVGARFPLSKAADAHRLQEENTLQKAGTLTGKIVLTPG